MNKVILKQKIIHKNLYASIYVILWNSLIIHEENTKEIMRHERKAKGVCK